MSFRIPISIHKVDRSLSSLLPDPKSLIRHISGEGTAVCELCDFPLDEDEFRKS